MHIRLATPRDVESVFAVDAITLRDPARRSFVESAIQSSECWLVEISGQVVGFVILQYSFFGNGFVPLVVVHDASRRKGIGTVLLEHAGSLCATSKLFTSTNESNAAMRALLARLGFEPSGVIHNLDAGDPELVYLRRIRA
jgi:ribosomal protein S18 acetylase RimI-like enzyme